MSTLPSTISALACLRRTPRMSRAQLDRWRDFLLRRLVRHAYDAVPYYRELFDLHAVRPETIRSTADLGRVPITAKSDLQSLAPDRIVAAGLDPARLLPRSSSGSDGRPLVIRRTWLEQNLLHLFRLRAQRSVGLRPSDRFATISLVRDPIARDNKRMGKILRTLGLYRRWRIDPFQDLETIVEELERLQPDVIGGYPGVLARVADRISELGSRRLHPRLLLSGAELLTPPFRRRIEQAFGAPVFDIYGCHELNLVAWQCPMTGELHTCDDAAVVEVLDGDRPVGVGERGEAVVTGLHSYAMPFIRYRLGDVVVRGGASCACGQPFATLRGIEGRAFEHFNLPDGRVIHAHQLGRMLLSICGQSVNQYQIVHERPDLVLIRIVRDPARHLNLEALEPPLRELLGPAVRCEIRLVREIPVEATGKSRVYKSVAGLRDSQNHADE